MSRHPVLQPRHPLSDAQFRKGTLTIVVAALVLVPASGIAIMTFLGVYPWPDLMYVLIEYSGPVIVANVILIFLFVSRVIDKIILTVDSGSQEDRIDLAKKLKRFLPPLFFGTLFLYTIQGALTANLSLEQFHGYQYDSFYYLYTLYGAIPALLISAFPIYFLLTDYLGRYLAPRGIRLTIAPLSFKFTILGLFTPLLIDTVLLLYYYDRTRYLTVETVSLWIGLLVIAGLGTLLAWRSMMNSMLPIQYFLADVEAENRANALLPIPQSLDEIGTLTGRYADVIRKNREIAGDLAYQQKFVNAVLENANALVVVLDKEGRVQRFNHACERLSGYTFDEVQNGYIWDYVLDPKEAETIKASAFDALANDPSKLTGSFTNYWVSREGARHLIEWSNSLLLDANGEMEYMVSVGIDVTERSKAESALIESYQQQQSILYLTQKLETASSYNEIIDALAAEFESTLQIKNCWLYLSDSLDRRYCNMIGRTQGTLDSLQHQPELLRLDMHSDKYLKGLLDSNDLVVIEDMRIDPRTDKDKVAATGIRTSIHIPMVVEGKWIGMLGLGTFGEEGVRVLTQSEITYLQSISQHVAVLFERIRMANELERNHALLERRVEERTRELKDAQVELLRRERLSTLGQLTATVSHELRNPLGAMRPSTYILRKKVDESDTVLIGAIERIERGIERCDHIIDELLDFTRTSEIETKRQDLDRWLYDVVKEYRFPDGIRTELLRGLDGLHTEFDAHRLRRAVVNILDNAAQAMTSEENGSIKEGAAISLGTRAQNGRVEIVLQDTGPGIPDDVMPRIFEPLFSTKNFGVGLGMPAVKQIMTQHNGGIEISTEAGQGTTVILWLPVSAAVTETAVGNSAAMR